MKQEDIKKFNDWCIRCQQVSIKFDEFLQKLIEKYEK